MIAEHPSVSLRRGLAVGALALLSGVVGAAPGDPPRPVPDTRQRLRTGSSVAVSCAPISGYPVDTSCAEPLLRHRWD